MEDPKRQKITHLTQREWVKQRPETYYGSMCAETVSFPRMTEQKRVEYVPLQLSDGVRAITNEAFANALDNCMRGGQTYIKVAWNEKTCTLVLKNDGSTLPVEQDDRGRWMVTLAFGEFQAGSNFDTAETGRKQNLFTSGLNGVGIKGLNVGGTRFKVRVVNKDDGKSFEQTWERNMEVVHPPKIKALSVDSNETVVEWTPDLVFLQTSPESMRTLCEWYAYNASLCAPPDVKVSFNGKQLKVISPEQFCKAFGGVGPFASLTHVVDGRRVCDLCVAVRGPDCVVPLHERLGFTHFFVNSTPCAEGTHSKYVLQKIADVLDAKAKTRRDPAASEVQVTPSFVARHALLVGSVLVEDPRYTSQQKTVLSSPAKSFGWDLKTLPDAFVSALERSALIDLALEHARWKADQTAAKACKTAPSSGRGGGGHGIPKYEPAHGKHATLIVTEGDSAKNFAVAGVSVTGRKRYGIYPLRGKFLNPRGMPWKAIMENKEASELIRILGLQLGHQYDAASLHKLPYHRLMVLSDQDVDGTHIAALLCNFLHVCAPSLLALKPDFVCRFATSLIRVTLPGTRTEVGFFSQVEYDAWVEARKETRQPLGVAKYYKGLGTSSPALAKEYFRNLDENTIVLRHSGDECTEAMDLFFNKKRSDDRKVFLNERCDPTAHVDYSQPETTFVRFVHDELLPQYATASLRRAIPFVGDGFKESLRKVFYGARHIRLTKEMSVANAAGKIASATHYHHRGSAMEDAIIGMAAVYAGQSNFNLLCPLGIFGTRHNHTAASAAYPMVKLNAPLHELLYPPKDDAVLKHVVDEGAVVEPEGYVSVVPSVLCFGTKGVAVGWSTECPMFHPQDVVDASLAWLEGRDIPDMDPWYRGFGGDIERTGGGNDDDDHTWTVRGKVEWRDKDLHVLEVPPFRETDAYKEDWTKKEFAERGILEDDDHTDERVHLILRSCKALANPLEDLGLVKKLTFGNVHLLNADHRLTKYTSPAQIVREHGALRLRLYESRLRHLLAAAEREHMIAHTRVLYLERLLDGTIDMRAFADDREACEAFDALGWYKDPDDDAHPYEYLLSMQTRSLNAKRANEYRSVSARKKDEWMALRECTPASEWTSELRALREYVLAQECFRRGPP